ncbi:hypothetical protein CHU95_19970 [Niveispirillum lacus]|uniref:Uncharacterized protein n=2 Tax=Niveispirillum lacus TaxID=1981099 RepID=A0A255YSK2_9PROT|nr:hypothetical protein CHU95_19970 [Niveispirillum lacus]
MTHVKEDVDRISNEDFSELKDQIVDDGIIGISFGLMASMFEFFCILIGGGRTFDSEAFECISKSIESAKSKLDELMPNKSELKV